MESNKKMEKIMNIEWLHATDIESGERVSVQVPKIKLRGLPRKEPARTHFIARLHEGALKELKKDNKESRKSLHCKGPFVP